MQYAVIIYFFFLYSPNCECCSSVTYLLDISTIWLSFYSEFITQVFILLCCILSCTGHFHSINLIKVWFNCAIIVLMSSGSSLTYHAGRLQKANGGDTSHRFWYIFRLSSPRICHQSKQLRWYGVTLFYSFFIYIFCFKIFVYFNWYRWGFLDSF